MPSSPEEFREFAQECLRWAGETKSQRHRQALLEMASTWIQAALEVERGLGLIAEGTPPHYGKLDSARWMRDGFRTAQIRPSSFAK
jgi:hypothetical protein